MAARLSAVVISRNEGIRLRQTVENLDETLPADAEIVVVDDGSTDASTGFLEGGSNSRIRLFRNASPTGVATARNYGARQTSGDVIIFCDAHIAVERQWYKPLVELVEDPRVAASSPAMCGLPRRLLAGYGLTLPHPNMEAKWRGRRIVRPTAVPILPGACMAMRRDVWEATGGFDETMRAAGCVDNEICLRLWLLGYQLWVTPEQMVAHHFRKRMPYPVPSQFALHNRLRMALVHFSPQRLDRAIGTLQKYEQFGEAMLLVMESNVAARRREIAACRVRKDNWFFEKFGISW